jgi:hypothetical protein
VRNAECGMGEERKKEQRGIEQEEAEVAERGRKIAF